MLPDWREHEAVLRIRGKLRELEDELREREAADERAAEEADEAERAFKEAEVQEVLGEFDDAQVAAAREAATRAREEADEAERLRVACARAVEKTKAQQRAVEQAARDETAPLLRQEHREAVARLAEALDAAAEARAEVDDVYAAARDQFRTRVGRPEGYRVPTAAGAWQEATLPWKALDRDRDLATWHRYAAKYVEEKD